MSLTDWPPFGAPLEPWQFGLGYVAMCDAVGCGEIRMGVGAVPEGVARISFETPDGEVTDAQIAGGRWIFRHVDASGAVAETSAVQVRAYDSAGALLVQGDTNALPPGFGGPPPPPPDRPADAVTSYSVETESAEPSP